MHDDEPGEAGTVQCEGQLTEPLVLLAGVGVVVILSQGDEVRPCVLNKCEFSVNNMSVHCGHPGCTALGREASRGMT